MTRDKIPTPDEAALPRKRWIVPELLPERELELEGLRQAMGREPGFDPRGLRRLEQARAELAARERPLLPGELIPGMAAKLDRLAGNSEGGR
jgi:hypothetical protein